MEIRHCGKVRGGWNKVARFHLHITPPTSTNEEREAIFAKWNEASGIAGYNILSTDGTNDWVFSVSSRREFALIPMLIRRALSAGFSVSTTQWDSPDWEQKKISLHENPAEFWLALAMAQAFYRE